MCEHGLLADTIDLEGDPVPFAMRRDLDLPAFAVAHEGHGEDRLQRVTLGAPRRRDVGFPRARPGREVEDAPNRRGWNPWAVIPDRDSARVDLNGDHGRYASFLGGIQGVVEQLLEDDERPL